MLINFPVFQLHMQSVIVFVLFIIIIFSFLQYTGKNIYIPLSFQLTYQTIFFSAIQFLYPLSQQHDFFYLLYV
jgi:hypothetical protein